MTQPTALMQMKDVADAVGLPIYELVARSVYMTEVGPPREICVRTTAR